VQIKFHNLTDFPLFAVIAREFCIVSMQSFHIISFQNFIGEETPWGLYLKHFLCHSGMSGFGSISADEQRC